MSRIRTYRISDWEAVYIDNELCYGDHKVTVDDLTALMELHNIDTLDDYKLIDISKYFDVDADDFEDPFEPLEDNLLKNLRKKYNGI